MIAVTRLPFHIEGEPGIVSRAVQAVPVGRGGRGVLIHRGLKDQEWKESTEVQR